MAASSFSLLGVAALLIQQVLCLEPCDPNVYKVINEPLRSTGYVTSNHDYEDLLCDRLLHPGWYRFTSGVGGQMPTSQVPEYHCGTKVGLWLSGGHPTQTNHPEPRKACGLLRGNPCGISTNIQVKNCGNFGNFYVYHLVPVHGCHVAYCAGNGVPCPPDKWSPTGMMPGCADAYPKMAIIRPPHLSNPIKKSDTFEFECDINFDPNRNDVGFEVTWKFDGKVDMNVPRSHVNGFDRTATLDQLFLQGHMGQSLTCSVSSHFLTSPGRRSPSIQNTNPYWMGIKTSVARMTVGENEKPKTIRIISTVPIICDPPTQKSCRLEIYLEPNNHDFKTTTSCTQVLTPGDWDPVKSEASTSFQVLAERDFKKDGDKNLVLHFDQIFTVDVSPIFNNYQIPFVQILTKDKRTSQCFCTGDPHCKTLDRQLLGPRHYYNYYLVGDFVMYKSTVREFEVQVRTWTCGNGHVTCICAVTMREGNDVVTIDLCHGTYGKSFPKLSIQHQGQLSQGTVVQKDHSGHNWVVYFPSGAFVQVKPGRAHMNVYVQAPEEDYEATQGLCGTFNSRVDDDLTRKDGGVEPFSHLPNRFTESWRVPIGDPHNLHDNDVKIDPKLNNDLFFCNCHKNKKMVDCKIENKAKVPGIHTRCKNCQIVAQGTGFKVNGRRRRQATYVDSDHHSANNYDVGLFFTPQVPSFPTPSGKTEADARRICTDTMQQYTVVRQCNTLVNLTFDGEIDNCVEDIKISDDVSWAMPSLDAAVMSCMEVVLKDPRFYVTNAATGVSEPPQFITTDVCPNHCSGHGMCSRGYCTCDGHYVGDDCSIDSSKPPALHGIVSTNKQTIDSDQCDVQVRPCKTVYVIGENIQNTSNLICRLKVLAYDGGSFRPTGQTINVGVEFKTMYHVGCKMPLRTSVNGHTIVGYNISVTNDGRRYSNEVPVFKMDSACMSCHSKGGACLAKADTCVIDGFCLHANESMPGQPDMLCMPGKSQYGWSSAHDTTTTTTTTARPTTTTKATTHAPTTRQTTSTTKVTTHAPVHRTRPTTKVATTNAPTTTARPTTKVRTTKAPTTTARPTTKVRTTKAPTTTVKPTTTKAPATTARPTTTTTKAPTTHAPARLPTAPLGGKVTARFDIWTVSRTGCQCDADHSSNDCACCDVGGCQCPVSNQHQCVQCGKTSKCGTPLPAPDNGVDGYTLVMNDCDCRFNTTLYNCACCQNGGCQCPKQHRNQCVLCGHMHTCGEKPWLYGPAFP